MSVKGQVNLVTDPTTFFTQILLGSTTPTAGFTPCKATGLSVMMIGFLPNGGPIPFSIPIPLSSTVSATDGSFTLPAFPANLNAITEVSVLLTLNGRPFYRTEKFPRAHTNKKLEIYVYQPNVPASDGVTAGQISTGLAGSGLPGNTKLKANSWGIGVVGSQSGVDIQFGIQMVPDTSYNLSLFFDLELHGYNIHVGFPADCGTNATDVLNQIKTGLQTSDSSANKIVSTSITKAFEEPPLNLSDTITKELLKKVSIQFVTMTMPNTHSWALSNKTDKKIVVVPSLTLGYPRRF
jgi:hypothetical protein